MISPTMVVSPVPAFFEPIRRTVLESLLGHTPVLGERGAVVGAVAGGGGRVAHYGGRSDRPIVTYVSRQDTGRRLLGADHDGLVRALRGLEGEGVCEVVVAEMEGMSVAEQLAVVARSTVGLGVSPVVPCVGG